VDHGVNKRSRCMGHNYDESQDLARFDLPVQRERTGLGTLSCQGVEAALPPSVLPRVLVVSLTLTSRGRSGERSPSSAPWKGNVKLVLIYSEATNDTRLRYWGRNWQ